MGRVTGALLRLLEEKKTTLPQPLPVKEVALPTPAARGRSEKVQAEGGSGRAMHGAALAAFGVWR